MFVEAGGGPGGSFVVLLSGAPSCALDPPMVEGTRSGVESSGSRAVGCGHGALLAREPLKNIKTLSFCIPFEGIFVESEVRTSVVY